MGRVVAQLVEQSLLTPEICSLTPHIGKFLSPNCKLNRKDKNKEKEAGNGLSLKKTFLINWKVRFSSIAFVILPYIPWVSKLSRVYQALSSFLLQLIATDIQQQYRRAKSSLSSK